MPTIVFLSSSSKVVVLGPIKGEVPASVWRYLVVAVPLIVVFIDELPNQSSFGTFQLHADEGL